MGGGGRYYLLLGNTVLRTLIINKWQQLNPSLMQAALHTRTALPDTNATVVPIHLEYEYACATKLCSFKDLVALRVTSYH